MEKSWFSSSSTCFEEKVKLELGIPFTRQVPLSLFLYPLEKLPSAGKNGCHGSPSPSQHHLRGFFPVHQLASLRFSLPSARSPAWRTHTAASHKLASSCFSPAYQLTCPPAPHPPTSLAKPYWLLLCPLTCPPASLPKPSLPFRAKRREAAVQLWLVVRWSGAMTK